MYKDKHTQYPNAGVQINFEQLSHKILSQFPIGGICAFIGGYFSDGNNNGFTNVLGNTIANVNSYLSTLDTVGNTLFKVCDGTLLNDPDSPIYNGSGRYLPNLTDERFLMGSGSLNIGSIGGSDTIQDHKHTYTLSANISGNPTISSHYHDVSMSSSSNSGTRSHAHRDWGGELAKDTSPTSTHRPGDDEGTTPNISEGENTLGDLNFSDLGQISAGYQVSHSISYTVVSQPDINFIANHTHPATTITGSIGTGGAPTTVNNIPKYLNCFYIQRIR